MHFMLKYGNNCLVAAQDIRMDLEWDPTILIVMISAIDSAIVLYGDIWPSRRFESATEVVSFDASFQLSAIRLVEFDVIRYLHSILLGNLDGFLDSPLQPALVLLPS
jgi:hypothetical protein